MPENELIRAAEVLPELSSGLRSSTMVLCQTQFARAQRIRRIKITTTTVLAASLAFAVFAVVMSPGDVDSQPIVNESDGAPEQTVQPVSPAPYHVSPGESPRTSEGLAVGLPGNKDELKRIDGKIDELQQRMMKAKMLPNLGL